MSQGELNGVTSYRSMRGKFDRKFVCGRHFQQGHTGPELKWTTLPSQHVPVTLRKEGRPLQVA